MNRSAPKALLDFVDPVPIWGPAATMELPSVAADGLELAIFEAADEFLRETAVLRGRFFVNIGQGVQDVDLTAAVPMEHLFPMFLHQLCLNGIWQRPVLPSHWQPGMDQSGTPMTGAMIHPTVIRLIPAPAENIAQGLGLEVSYRLQRPYTCVPKLLSDYYYDAILDGVLGRMKRHKARPYTDTATSSYHLSRFRNSMRVAKADVQSRWGATGQTAGFNLDWSHKPNTPYRRAG